MHAVDWRLLTDGEAASVHEAEEARWRSRLHWDTRQSIARIESARRAGTLPGLAARDEEGAVRGWTFYLVHERSVQIGALAADSPEATATLLDALAHAGDTIAASAAMLFVFSDAPALVPQLVERGFAVERYRYLETALTEKPVRSFAPASWSAGERHAVAALFERAYSPDEPARPFARGGTSREWREYATQLVTTRACGAFVPEASFLVPGATPGELAAATLVTRLSGDTAHVAQVAVAPEARGQGLSTRLLSASLDAARAAGCVRATLLVSERNVTAARLYQKMGFEDVASFVSAFQDLPTGRDERRTGHSDQRGPR